MTKPSPAERAVSVRRIGTGDGHLHVSDYPGAGPAVVMAHGFPDDSRIYNRVAPLLAPRRVVTFDWLGYGRSDRGGAAHVADHQRHLGAVLDALGLQRVVLAAHDASGDPVGILARGLFLLRRWLPAPAFDAFLRTQFPAPQQTLAPARHAAHP